MGAGRRVTTHGHGRERSDRSRLLERRSAPPADLRHPALDPLLLILSAGELRLIGLGLSYPWRRLSGGG